MRRTGKLRYILTRSITTGVVAAVALAAVFWFKTGTIALNLEAIIAFVIFGLFDAARARSDWNKFESIYPDIGNDQ
jgi:hypothetical protein